MTYEIDGTQCVLVSAAATPSSGQPWAIFVIAFALPRSLRR